MRPRGSSRRRSPSTGICLGHQILSLAFGASTFKLEFGHRGANQPVQDLRSGRVLVTSQNHGYAVREEVFPLISRLLTAISTTAPWPEVRHRSKKVAAVQFHPEHRLAARFGPVLRGIRGSTPLLIAAIVSRGDRGEEGIRLFGLSPSAPASLQVIFPGRRT